MAERLTINAEKRSVVGKQVKQLRRDGWVPAVIYGQGDNHIIQFERRELRRALRQTGTTELIDVQFDGQSKTVLAREIQQHVTRGDVLHLDLYEVNMRETLIIDVPLVHVGQVQSDVAALGSVSLVVQMITVECLPGDLPAEIEVDVSKITNLEDMIAVKDLVIPQGVTVLTDPETLVTTFDYARVDEAEEEEEEEELMFGASADAVEVIKKGHQDEEEEF